ncbi:MAG: hypothetical protein RRX93_06100 [Bacteroidales bacterium]
MKKNSLIFGLAVLLSWVMTPNLWAQTSRDTAPVETVSERGTPPPANVEKLLQEKKYHEAIAEFNKFKKSKFSSNPFDISYIEVTMYQRMAVDVPVSNPDRETYRKKAETLADDLLKNFSDKADAYFLKATFFGMDLPDKTVELLNRSIELDGKYAMAYSLRGRAYLQLNYTDKACADFFKARELGDKNVNVEIGAYCQEQLKEQNKKTTTSNTSEIKK